MFEPIAIVGRGCVLPGALSPQELWMDCREGKNRIASAPAGLWRLDVDSVLGPDTAGTYVDRVSNDRGGYVRTEVRLPDGLADVDAATSMDDPILRWLLHCGVGALQEPGLDLASKPGLFQRTGLIMENLSYPTASCNFFVEGVLQGRPQGNARDRFCSGLPVLLAARALGLGGNAFALDAACASYLYAVKLACDALQDGQADLMLAGGINHADDLFLHLGFTALQALSRSGYSRPFAQHADGLLPADGAGMVALKRLSDAIRDGSRILGVIRGIGLSNDGRQRGFLAPDSGGQLRAMRAAYAQSGLTSDDIGYVECHAIGTPLGYAVELQTLRSIYQGARKPVLGSIKGGVGHAVAAAGISGLLRVLGAFEANIFSPHRPARARLG